MSYKAIIIDDEKIYIRSLLKLLETYSNEIVIKSTANDVDQGIKDYNVFQPDLVFLDVQMPPKTGFDFLDQIRNDAKKPHVIFTTSFDKFALKAIKYNALDYLLKPIDPIELDNAIAKFFEQNTPSVEQDIRFSSVSTFFNNPNNSEKVVLPVAGGFKIIKLKDIIYVQAQRNYSLFLIKDQKEILSSKTLKHYQDVFDQSGLKRWHQSYLINPFYITGFKKGEPYQVELNGMYFVPIAKSKKEDFLSFVIS